MERTVPASREVQDADLRLWSQRTRTWSTVYKTPVTVTGYQRMPSWQARMASRPVCSLLSYLQRLARSGDSAEAMQPQ
jgi:hypothetical protein